MAEPQVYLEKLSAFSRMLQLQGLAVSPKETADATQILIAIGFEDRQQVKTALRTIYAKSRDQQLIFDRVFDGFFLSEEQMRQQAQQQAQQDRQIQENIEQLRKSGHADGLTEEQQYAFGTMSEEERQRLQEFAEKYKENAKRNPNLYSNFIHSVFAKALLEQQMRLEDAAVGCEGADPELGILYRDISQFSDVEIPKAISIIQTISNQINGELTAKRNRKTHSGKLDFRRTIRKGLETGGRFYHLHYKRKPSRRKRLVLLCDVSGSMMQFSEFALRFIQNLNQVSDSSRVFLFSEEIYEADPFSLQNMDLFRNYVKECGVYGKGTDLGAALEQLCSFNPKALNQYTTLIILSDTKTINQPRAMEALLEAKRQAGRVIWLNPIPQRHWPHIRSVQAFATLCTMICCSTLQELAAACRRLTSV
ncbi:MAG: VWA domain-containing protein [Oscillospiraceae bacterium]|nr:VWA domain-containing protein [Oscillospiraceae bacterium]